MKPHLAPLLLLIGFLCAEPAAAQQKDRLPAPGQTVAAGRDNKTGSLQDTLNFLGNIRNLWRKTLAGSGVLGNLYQISVNDISADDKSVTFKSTIFGLHKIFNDSINAPGPYRRLAFERYFEPLLTYKYVSRFSPSNLTIGFNFALVHRNDVTTDARVNAGSKEFDYIRQLDDGPLSAVDAALLNDMARLYPDDVKTQKKGFGAKILIKKKFMHTGNPAVLDEDPDLRLLFDTTAALSPTGKKISLRQAVVDDLARIDSIYQDIENDWNVVVSPGVSYALNLARFQGYQVALKAIRGFHVLKDRNSVSQLTLFAAFQGGDDTVVLKSNLRRVQLKDQVGFNQVILSRKVSDDNGNVARKPALELGITGGYQVVMSGRQPGEPAGQPALTAKLGLLVGRESWLVFPFEYNFATHKGLGSISVTVNLGDPPFK